MPARRRERWLHAVPDAPAGPANLAEDMAGAGAGPRDTGPRDAGSGDAGSGGIGPRGIGPRGIGRRGAGSGGTTSVRRAKADSAQEAEVDPEADPEAVARLICLRMLTGAPRTRAQLAQALRKRGVPQPVAEAVLSRFAEVGLIDDAMFARAWVESRHVGRGLARRALASELGQRGVAKDDIDAAIGLLSPDAELATARELVERKLAGTRSQPPGARIRRLAGMLARKGYPAGLAYQVVREALEREGADGATLGLLPDEPEDASAGFEE